MKPIPMLSSDLIKELDEQFPDKCPELGDADRAVWYKAGQRSVVNHLIARQKAMEESIEGDN